MNNNYNSDYVRSNLEFINDKMNNLQNMISKSEEITSNKHDVNSVKDKNMLYSKMNSIVDKYYSSQTGLMEKLNNEAKFIKNVGEKYYELDKQMKDEVDKI